MSDSLDKLTKKQKKLIEEFQKEFVVSKKYEYSFGKDVCGKSIDRILILFRAGEEKEDEE